MKNARHDSVCLGEDEDDWRTCAMDQMGDKKKRIGRRFRPPLGKADAMAKEQRRAKASMSIK